MGNKCATNSILKFLFFISETHKKKIVNKKQTKVGTDGTLIRTEDL